MGAGAWHAILPPGHGHDRRRVPSPRLSPGLGRSERKEAGPVGHGYLEIVRRREGSGRLGGHDMRRCGPLRLLPIAFRWLTSSLIYLDAERVRSENAASPRGPHNQEGRGGAEHAPNAAAQTCSRLLCWAPWAGPVHEGTMVLRPYPPHLLKEGPAPAQGGGPNGRETERRGGIRRWLTGRVRDA